MKKYYPEVNANPDFPQLEQEILNFWNEQALFQRSVDARPAKGASGNTNEFIFYDGPPFANGLPHYGHLLTGFVKDVFARYQTMKGKRVERRFGWDCHGLPAEMGSEKELGISGRAAIQQFGIDKFNEHCRTSVMKYTHEWEYYVNRQARWVDFKNDYKTMDTNFMESVLWAFKQLYDKGLVYEAHRVMPYSWAAETPLSNFETKLDNSYREKEDKAITVAFELSTPPAGAPQADKYYILAWTTTPWTLPSNLALAVSKNIQYTFVLKNNACYILAIGSVDRYKELQQEDGKWHGIDNGIAGENLVGLSYHPLFPYFASHKHAFKILDGSNFVTDGDGTGVVHIAPGFGEDDQRVAEANGIELVVPVDGQGKYTDEIFDIPALSLKGLNVIADTRKSEDEPYKEEQLKKFGLANLRIINYLKSTGQLIKQEDFKHNYPHCWRTDTPLIYRAMPSWYVEVTKFRDRAVELNKQINWIPEHIRDGQMGHMLATAPDWSISRNRFWGTPIPVWRKESAESGVQGSELKVFGSIAELENFFGVEVKDLHRPFIDTLTLAKDGSRWKRVEDVFDCWFESGSMPFAQVHYPFENKEWFEHHFPADFITEYVGQTRGWFNTLIMLSTALFDKPPFKNCICHGVVLDSETGLKYSKRLKNYKDPKEVMDKFGADALRWLMIASPVMRGQDISVDPDGKFIRDVVRLYIKPIWNAYNFFCLYANADGIKAAYRQNSESGENLMDAYILAKCGEAVETIERAMDAYDAPSATDAVSAFFEVLNNWYIRRNKERFWKEEKDADKQAAYDTLYTVLHIMCRAAAPLLPFTLEDIYKGLTGEDSVHLADFPHTVISPKSGIHANTLITQMDWARDVCNSALAIRNKVNLRVRQPLSQLQVVWEEETRIKFAKLAKDYVAQLGEIIKDEVNVKTLRYSDQSSNPLRSLADFKLSINNPILGKRLPEKMKQIIPASKKGEWQRVGTTVEICGELLQPGEYSIQLEPKPEYKDRAQALSSNDALVILDITITPELVAEGIARDVVRAIQQTRKDADLHVSDRIEVYLEADAAILEAVKAHSAYICQQTLANTIHEGAAPAAAFVAQAQVEEQNIKIGIAKH